MDAYPLLLNVRNPIARYENMSQQLSLFDNPPDPKLSRATDPDTSREAEAELKSSGKLGAQCEHVLEIVERYQGRTSAELAWLGDLLRHLVARRLPDLEKRGLVRKGDARKCRQNGTNAITWWSNK